MTNKKIKVELTIREDLDVNKLLDELDDWLIRKNYINPFLSKLDYLREKRNEN